VYNCNGFKGADANKVVHAFYFTAWDVAVGIGGVERLQLLKQP
jgi:hypothetical protein